ncbi:hypothetical protein M407DRAFT_18493 [Tulasnella calospora MUT 4182]|uniref:Protein kinase domain-containing protein n=1 Tax=Tulasnella calospora MUT 4182 TaxID=1051891 RepID=A0A0C3QV44_9AGAM|nr:hypothetical protein M407DRAFT_18493 [Tulasnella calospora MUT 4182]
MAPSDPWKSSSKHDPDSLKEGFDALQVRDMETPQSCTGMSVAGVKKAEKFAQKLLATLSGRRLSISEIKVIGNSPRDGGGYADVLVATLLRKSCNTGEPKKIAVKKLRFVLSDDMTEEKVFRSFVNELLLLDKMSHPNIVEILSFVEDIEKRIAWLVFLWEDNGNLRDFLRSGKWEIPERGDTSQIQDVTLRLEYLHTRQPPICHGDLKSLNILVNSSNRAIITDFGSARITNSQQSRLSVTASNGTLTLTGLTFSFRWAPPEVLNGEQVDLASDMGAGLDRLGAITDCYPFEELDGEFQVTMRIVQGQLPLIYGHDQLSRIHLLYSVMERCWNPDPKQRPSSTECRKIIEWVPSAIPVKQTSERSKIRSATLLLQLGEINRLQNRYEEASNCYMEGLTIAQSTGDWSTLARLLVQLAANHQADTHYVEAKSCYTQALSIY